jgi:NAD+ kinase
MAAAQPPNKITTVGIVSKPRSEEAVHVVPELVRWLAEQKIRVQMDPQTAGYLRGSQPEAPPVLPRESVAEGTLLLIVRGGDGTLLSASRALGGRDIPLFAVNLGNLGFLTAITVDDLYPQLQLALEGRYGISRRRMLHTELWRKQQLTATYEALNDIALAKADIARILDLEVHVDDHLMCLYKADGLIVSTPTGSTAYSLSAGGPIVIPGVDALCITPICPHMLTNRPVIVPGEAVIRLTLCSDNPSFLTADGQVGQQLERDDRVVCRRSGNTVSLIRPEGADFFDVLREKLKWGGR